MSSMRLTVLVCLLAVVVSLTGIAGERKFEKKFQVSPGGTLTVSTDIGSVKVTGTNSNEVSILVQMEGRQKDLDDFDVKAEQTSGGVDVTGKTHTSGWNFFRFHDFDATYTISVPRNYNLRLSTSGGDVEAREILGTVKGHTSGGDVSVFKAEGNVELGTSGGDVHVESVKGNVNAETSGGDIRVKSVTGDVEAGTSGGNVAVGDVEGKVRAETSGGNVAVKVRGGNKGVHAETSGGNVEVYVAKNCAANLDASTSGGDVECDLPVSVVGKIKESSIKGTINGGGPLIYAHTSGGNIRVRPLE
jgi:DUF4097 and DUF4098 domain-containing protein YvlB